VTLAVTQFNAYQNRLAEAVVSYLNRGVLVRDPRDYFIPWYMVVPAALALGIPILTLGGAIWGALGLGLAGASLAVVRIEKWPSAARLLASTALTGTGYLAVLLAYVLFARAERKTELVLPGKAQWYSVAFSPDGKTLAGGTSQGEVILWDLTTGKETAKIEIRDSDQVMRIAESLAFSPDGKTLAAAGHSGLKLWDVPGLKERAGPEIDAQAVAFSADGKTLAVLRRFGPVTLRDVGTGQERTIPIELGAIPKGYFGSDCLTLAVQDDDFEGVVVWDLAKGKK
jgi:hypothetical protein